MDARSLTATRGKLGRGVLAAVLWGSMAFGTAAAQSLPFDRPPVGPVPIGVTLPVATSGTLDRQVGDAGLVRQTLSAGVPATQSAVPTQPSIVVNGYGTASAPAETARIQFLIGTAYDATMAAGSPMQAPPAEVAPTAGTPAGGGVPPAGTEGMPATPSPVTATDLAPIVQAIVGAGAERGRIEVLTGAAANGFYGPGGPGTGLVTVTVERPSLDVINRLVDAGSGAVTGRLVLQQLGVGYDIADCTALERQARQQAVDRARQAGKALAEALGGTLGDIIQATDTGGYGPLPTTGCPPPPELASYVVAGAPFDTPPFDPTMPAEARTAVQLNLIFAFKPGSS